MMISGDKDGREVDSVVENDLENDIDGRPMAINDSELELADEEERLPWLESAEYDDDVSSNDTGRLIGFALLGLLAVGLIVGLIWWLSNPGHDPELAPDGSTIAAPDGDYKERPENPGGRTFEGTGDVAPAVGEGQTREGRLADDDRGGEDNSDARPSIDTARSGSVDPEANSGEIGASGTAGASGGVAVQVGAYSTRDSAVAGWSKLQRQTDALNGFKYRVEQGTADIGTVYRLQAVAGDAAAANKLCSALKGDGVPCQVKR